MTKSGGLRSVALAAFLGAPALAFAQAPEDLRKAQILADAEGLFLQGKAYHTGRGVEVDLQRAAEFYGRAAEQGHARALHNLGLLELDEFHDLPAARKHLGRALALGLKLPTLYTLGRAYDRPHMMIFDGPDDWVTARDYFVQAFEAGYGPEALDEAVAAAVRAALAPGGREDGALGKALRAEALRLGRLGAEQNRPRCLQNLGALHYYDKDYAAALPWLRRAADLGQPTALYTLGLMHAEGLGVPKDPAASLEFHERAAVLGQEESRQEVEVHWQHEVAATPGRALLLQHRAHLQALRSRRPEEGSFLKEALDATQAHLDLMDELERNARSADMLPRGPLKFRIQLFDMPPDQGGVPESSLEWYIAAVAFRPEGRLEIPGTLAKGRLDRQGRAQVDPATCARLKEALAQGRTLIFSWPGQRRTLRWTKGPANGLSLEIGSVVRD